MEEPKIFKGKLASEQDQTSYSPGMGEMVANPQMPAHIRTLVITMDVTNGNLQVAGPIEDKVLCYGMMEGAKDVIQEHNAKRIAVSEEKI